MIADAAIDLLRKLDVDLGLGLDATVRAAE